MPGSKLLQYLGLQRAPGARRTATDSAFTAVFIVVGIGTMFLTRELDLWPRIAVPVAVSVVLGVLGGVILTTMAVRRSRNSGE